MPARSPYGTIRSARKSCRLRLTASPCTLRICTLRSAVKHYPAFTGCCRRSPTTFACSQEITALESWRRHTRSQAQTPLAEAGGDITGHRRNSRRRTLCSADAHHVTYQRAREDCQDYASHRLRLPEQRTTIDPDAAAVERTAEPGANQYSREERCSRRRSGPDIEQSGRDAWLNSMSRHVRGLDLSQAYPRSPNVSRTSPYCEDPSQRRCQCGASDQSGSGRRWDE